VPECADRRTCPAPKARAHAPLKINVRRDHFRALSIAEPSLLVGVVDGDISDSSYGREHLRKIRDLVNARKPQVMDAKSKRASKLKFIFTTMIRRTP
jgi:hypothetical protein